MEFACIQVPWFGIAIARRENPRLEGRPVVVGGAPEEHAEVTACSAEAMAAGVAPGMSLRRALALCPGAVFLPLAASVIRAEAERLASLLRERSPVVEEVGEGHLHCEVRGLPALFGLGTAEYLAQLRESLAGATGLPVLAGGAATVFAAHAACSALGLGFAVAGDRGGPRSSIVVVPGREREFLALLPVEVLPVEPAMHQRLRLFGIERLGQVAALPLSALQAQFGPAGRRVWELANGRDASRLQPASAEARIAVEVELPGPAVSQAALLAGSEAALGRAFSDDALQGRAVRMATWWAGLEDGTRVTRRLAFREPTGDPRHALFVLRSRLETLRLPSPAVSVGVELRGMCSEYAHQQLLWSAGQGRRRELDEAIAQLHARAGEPQVFRIVEVQPWSRIPERQAALVAYGS
ncbi:MAG: DNA polymerase IV [Tepidiforma sp.]|nr:MAG: DNA polymerase IV [Tepidiforma sp.]